MTRPTDAAIARAFWQHFDARPWEFASILYDATKFDADSPAGTVDKICDCGYVRVSFGCDDAHKILAGDATERDGEVAESPFLQGTGCAPMPGPVLHTIPEKVTTPPERVQIPAESKRVCTVSTCRAEMRPGLRCSSPHCGLKE